MQSLQDHFRTATEGLTRFSNFRRNGHFAPPGCFSSLRMPNEFSPLPFGRIIVSLLTKIYFHNVLLQMAVPNTQPETLRMMQNGGVIGRDCDIPAKRFLTSNSSVVKA